MQIPRSLKEELQAITPLLEEMRKKRRERNQQFSEVMKQINRFSEELSLSKEDKLKIPFLDESDLSLKRLDDLRNQLHLLEKEKVCFLHCYVSFRLSVILTLMPLVQTFETVNCRYVNSNCFKLCISGYNQ